VYRTWFPCYKFKDERLLVNITGSRPKEKATMLEKECGSLLSRLDPASGSKFVTCPKVQEQFTFREPIWISFWTSLGALGTILTLFGLTKMAAIASLAKRPQRTVSASKESIFHNESYKRLMDAFCRSNFCDVSAMAIPEKIDEKGTDRFSCSSKPDYTPAVPRSSKNVNFRYYKEHPLGLILFYSMIAFTLYLQIFLALNVSDYYGSWFTQNIRFFKSDYLLAYSFIAVWHIMVFILFAWKIIGVASIRAFCRIPVKDVSEAEYVVVSRYIDRDGNGVSEETGFLKYAFAMVHWLELKADQLFNFSLEVKEHKIQISPNINVPHFYDQCIRYVYSPITHEFRAYPYSVGNSLMSLSRSSANSFDQGGLCEEEVNNRIDLVGCNEIRIPKQSFLQLWMEELSGWFYLYQGSCLWVWYWFAYFKMGLVLTSVITFASLVKTRVRFTAKNRIQMLAVMNSNSTVLRDHNWVTVSSRDVVPGDIIAIESGLVSVDVLLCHGQAVLDESCLTGESRPIRKFPLPSVLSEDEMFSSTDHKRHVLLAGTTILQSDRGSYGFVLKTNVGTSRGQVIQKMIHPKPMKFVFDEQLKVVLAVMLVWGILCFSMVIFMMGLSYSSWFYAIFIISEVISPLLPAVLVAGQSVAADRLVKNHNIFCIDLPRIAMSGKTQIFCFDKTGTLTKEGLDLWCCVPGELPFIGDSMKEFSELNSQLKLGLATCHSVSSHGGQMLGNPVDVAMIQYTKCSLQDEVASSESEDVCGKILKRHEFVHAKQTMGVVVEDYSSASLKVFVKGSYERVRNACDPSTIPSWYDEAARSFAKLGGYVLAIGFRELPDSMTKSESMSLERAEIEKDLRFLGLIVFRNCLKPDSKDAILELQRGLCRTVMVCGST
jgi:cation-transporting ATPase 13A3/4/5